MIFSETLIVPANVTKIDPSVLKLELKSSQELQDMSLLDFTWNVTTYQSTEMLL